MLNQKQKIFIIIGVIIIVGIIVLYYINSSKDVYDYEGNIGDTEEIAEEKGEVGEEKIIVHVTGAVEKEGIVEIKEDARINDVIEAAGGITKDANLDNVNLAYAVEDGQKIYIPSKLDNSENIDDGDVITTSSAGINVVEEDKEGEKNGLININKASLEKLQELPGIGAGTAQKIITYRTENGKFKKVEDIKNVSGIGDAKYETIKSHICV